MSFTTSTTGVIQTAYTSYAYYEIGNDNNYRKALSWPAEMKFNSVMAATIRINTESSQNKEPRLYLPNAVGSSVGYNSLIWNIGTADLKIYEYNENYENDETDQPIGEILAGSAALVLLYNNDPDLLPFQAHWSISMLLAGQTSLLAQQLAGPGLTVFPIPLDTDKLAITVPVKVMKESEITIALTKDDRASLFFYEKTIPLQSYSIVMDQTANYDQGFFFSVKNETESTIEIEFNNSGEEGELDEIVTPGNYITFIKIKKDSEGELNPRKNWFVFKHESSYFQPNILSLSSDDFKKVGDVYTKELSLEEAYGATIWQVEGGFDAPVDIKIPLSFGETGGLWAIVNKIEAFQESTPAPSLTLTLLSSPNSSVELPNDLASEVISTNADLFLISGGEGPSPLISLEKGSLIVGGEEPNQPQQLKAPSDFSFLISDGEKNTRWTHIDPELLHTQTIERINSYDQVHTLTKGDRYVAFLKKELKLDDSLHPYIYSVSFNGKIIPNLFTKNPTDPILDCNLYAGFSLSDSFNEENLLYSKVLVSNLYSKMVGYTEEENLIDLEFDSELKNELPKDLTEPVYFYLYLGVADDQEPPLADNYTITLNWQRVEDAYIENVIIKTASFPVHLGLTPGSMFYVGDDGQIKLIEKPDLPEDTLALLATTKETPPHWLEGSVPGVDLKVGALFYVDENKQIKQLTGEKGKFLSYADNGIPIPIDLPNFSTQVATQDVDMGGNTLLNTGLLEGGILVGGETDVAQTINPEVGVPGFVVYDGTTTNFAQYSTFTPIIENETYSTIELNYPDINPFTSGIVGYNLLTPSVLLGTSKKPFRLKWSNMSNSLGSLSTSNIYKPYGYYYFQIRSFLINSIFVNPSTNIISDPGEQIQILGNLFVGQRKIDQDHLTGTMLPYQDANKGDITFTPGFDLEGGGEYQIILLLSLTSYDAIDDPLYPVSYTRPAGPLVTIDLLSEADTTAPAIFTPNGLFYSDANLKLKAIAAGTEGQVVMYDAEGMPKASDIPNWSGNSAIQDVDIGTHALKASDIETVPPLVENETHIYRQNGEFIIGDHIGQFKFNTTTGSWSFQFNPANDNSLNENNAKKEYNYTETLKELSEKVASLEQEIKTLKGE